MPDIKLRDGSGVEQTYTGVDCITVPLADGTGTYTYGMTDEDLTFSLGNSTNFCFPINDYIASRSELLERVKIKPYSDKVYTVAQLLGSTNNDNIDSLTFNIPDGSKFYTCQMLNNPKLKKLPNINGNNLIGSCNGPLLLFSNTTPQNIMITEQEYMDWISHFESFESNITSITTTTSSLTATFCPILEFDTTNINKKVGDLFLNNNVLYISQFFLFPLFDWTHIRNILILPNQATTNYTSSVSLSNAYFSDSFTFYNNGSGEPYKARMKCTFDWSSSYRLGWCDQSYDSSIFITKYYNGKVHPYTTNIFTSNSMTIEQAQARYNELKAEDKWYSCASNRVTYDGKTRYIAELFSRYNHDSAVETINSLPNVKDYGYTCTLKLMKYSGALTDGGGVNTLTEEEIAVATAKGWTITLS